MSIIIKNLTKTYDTHKVLDNLSLEIKSSSLFGLLGVNGAGKTTLLSILNSLIRPDSGTIDIYGYDLFKDSSSIKAISSYVPQSYAFYPNLSSYENLEFFGAIYGLRGAKLESKIRDVISFCSLEDYVHKRASTFSGGLKRRLNIAIGLLNNPKVLYLDEPTVGIDPHSRRALLDVIKKINSEFKTTILYTSHYLDEMEYLCDEVALLDGGQITKQGSIDSLKKSSGFSSLEEMFLGAIS